MRIIVLVALILSGIFVGVAAMAFVLLLSGESLSTVMDQSGMMGGSTARMRWLLLINHATMFLLPAIAWSLIYYKRKWISGLGLKPHLHWIHLLAGIAFLMVSYPIVAKSYEINQSFNLPGWMDQMEGQTAELLKSLLVMDHPLALLANLVVIAFIPGLGEELIFRGIIQKELYRYFKSPWVAIIVASLIFSAMHFQFAGFLPRFFLGMILGLLFYWTNNLWTSILVHSFNNAFQVILTYFNPKLMDQDFEQSVPVAWYVLLISVLLSLVLGRWFEQKKVAEEKIAAETMAPVVMDTIPEPPTGDGSEDQNRLS